MSFGGLFDGDLPYGGAAVPAGVLSQSRFLPSATVSKPMFGAAGLSLGLVSSFFRRTKLSRPRSSHFANFEFCLFIYSCFGFVKQSNLEGKGELSRLAVAASAGDGRGGCELEVLCRNKDEENESRSGSDNFEGGSGDDLDLVNPRKKKRYHRHTPQQIQELEKYSTKGD